MRFALGNMKKVLITGANGFLGRYVAMEFLSSGFVVAGVDAAQRQNGDLPEGIDYRSMLLPHPALVDFLSGFGPDVCIHCAGSASVAASFDDPDADFAASVVVTRAILSSLRKTAPRCRSVFLSSAAVYGEPSKLPVSEDDLSKPLSPYGYHKRICELLFEKSAILDGLPTASLRIFSAYGPGLRRQVLWEMASQLAEGKPLRLKGTGDETRDFIHAADVARAVRLVAEKAPAKGEVYNVASGCETSIHQAAKMLCSFFPGAEPPHFAGQPIKGDPQRWRADCSRLQALGFGPTLPLKDGLAALARWAGKQQSPPRWSA